MTRELNNINQKKSSIKVGGYKITSDDKIKREEDKYRLK